MRLLYPFHSIGALGWARLTVGLAQGFVLWLLVEAGLAHVWPATVPLLYASLLRVFWLIPVFAVLGLGNMRRMTLALWLAAALVLVAAAAMNAAANTEASGAVVATATLGAWFGVEGSALLALALFIGQSLVTAGDTDRRLIAHYPTYFDVAWKYEVQILLAVFFLGLFWGVLWLGAALFNLIGLTFLQDLIRKSWFAHPASTLAFAYAIHASDAGAGLVRALRNLLHALLSWLLPLATLIVLGFLASLPFTGLGMLWRTHHGSHLVLGQALVLVVLVNTVYREGDGAARPAVLRWSGTIAALTLVPLVAIATYGVGLRVAQYGWTASRVVGAAYIVVLACYAVGYLWAVFAKPWLKPVERTNVVTAVIVVATIAALATPIADPARLSVADQVARLERGEIVPANFDFAYLRFHGGRWGQRALERLAQGEGTVKEAANRTLAQRNQFATLPPRLAERGAIPVYPQGAVLPDSFLHQDWSSYQPRYVLPQCLVNGAVECEAFVVTDDAGPILIVRETAGARRGVVFRYEGDKWAVLGQLSSEFQCASVLDALRSGKGEWVAAERKDLEVAGLRITVTPPFVAARTICK